MLLEPGLEVRAEEGNERGVFFREGAEHGAAVEHGTVGEAGQETSQIGALEEGVEGEVADKRLLRDGPVEEGFEIGGGREARGLPEKTVVGK